MPSFALQRAMLFFHLPVALEGLRQADVEGMRHALQVAFPEAESLTTGLANPDDTFMSLLDGPAILMQPDLKHPAPPFFVVNPTGFGVLPPLDSGVAPELVWRVLRAMTARFVSMKDAPEAPDLALARRVTSRLMLVAREVETEELFESGWPSEVIDESSRLMDTTRMRHHGKWDDGAQTFDAVLERQLLAEPQSSALVPVIFSTVTAIPGSRSESVESSAVGALAFEDGGGLVSLNTGLEKVHNDQLLPITSNASLHAFPWSESIQRA